MMTKKDYQRAAKIVRSQLDAVKRNKKSNMKPYDWEIIEQFLIGAFVAFFRTDNPKFDSERFRAACEES